MAKYKNSTTLIIIHSILGTLKEWPRFWKSEATMFPDSMPNATNSSVMAQQHNVAAATSYSIQTISSMSNPSSRLTVKLQGLMSCSSQSPIVNLISLNKFGAIQSRSIMNPHPHQRLEMLISMHRMHWNLCQLL